MSIAFISVGFVLFITMNSTSVPSAQPIVVIFIFTPSFIFAFVIGVPAKLSHCAVWTLQAKQDKGGDIHISLFNELPELPVCPPNKNILLSCSTDVTYFLLVQGISVCCVHVEPSKDQTSLNSVFSSSLHPPKIQILLSETTLAKLYLPDQGAFAYCVRVEPSKDQTSFEETAFPLYHFCPPKTQILLL